MNIEKRLTMNRPKHRAGRKHFDHAEKGEKRGFRMVANYIGEVEPHQIPGQTDRKERAAMIDPELKILGNTIRHLRHDRKLSQIAFAKRCDLHRTYISDVERGARNVTLASLMRITRALGTTVSALTQNLENNALPSEEPCSI